MSKTLEDNLLEIKRQKDTYLLPENIKNGLTILGITGTFSGGGGSSEGIKLFDTIANMQNSSNNNNGDLAIVYNNTSNDYQGIFEFEDNVWNIAETGLSATSRDVVSNSFQGKNGVEIGTLNINTNISKDDLKFKSEVYDRMSTLSLDSSITNISNLFANRLDLVNVPFINLDNITNMENTFYNCRNLSESTYTTITNMLPNASNLTNQYLSNIGLNIENFTNEQINILNSKGYIDAVIIEPLAYYNIYYNTNDEV